MLCSHPVMLSIAISGTRLCRHRAEGLKGLLLMSPSGHRSWSSLASELVPIAESTQDIYVRVKDGKIDQFPGRVGGCWKWCSPYSHDTSFVQMASGSALVYGFGYALGIRAYGSGIGHRLVFRDVLRIQAWVCLRRLALASGIRLGFGCLVCMFGKELRMQECAMVLRSRSFRESREKSGSTVGSAGKSWKPAGGKVPILLLVSREC